MFSVGGITPLILSSSTLKPELDVINLMVCVWKFVVTINMSYKELLVCIEEMM